jgi:general secretion pathway protein D
MLSSTPMTPNAFYEAFLSILQVHGFVAVPSGDTIKIIPDANARQVPANDLPGRVSATSDEIVTQVVAVRNVSAAQLVPILRPLIPQYGHLAAYPASNMLIISDRASNVNRMMRIIQRIDQQGDEAVDVIPLQNASAAEVVRIVNSLYAGGAAAEGAGMPAVKVIADERTNSVLVSGETSQRLRLKTLITHLDTPLETGGDTQVRYLRYADAEKIADKLKAQLQGTQQATGGAPGAQGAQAAQEKGTTIWAEPTTNALVITAPPKLMRSLMGIIDRLDIRRPQVLVEAILVEVLGEDSAELGVNWLIDGSRDNFAAGGFISPVGGTGIGDLVAAALDPDSINPAAAPTGFTVGVARVQDTGTNFAAMLRAIRGTANTNIISTPSTVTLDNQEAQIKVAQEVPFVTGSFSSTQGGTTTPGVVNPFQTIQRQDVGTILKITPQITDDGNVLMKIEIEASALAESSQEAVDLITNKRTISTNVLARDGEIIVLGGLIADQLREGEQRVPFLGAIPVIGELFKTRSVEKTKTNLMVFIRPKVLMDAESIATETGAKYNYLRQLQITRNKGRAQLLPGQRQPTLPSLEELQPDSLPPGTVPEANPATGLVPDVRGPVIVTPGAIEAAAAGPGATTAPAAPMAAPATGETGAPGAAPVVIVPPPPAPPPSTDRN